MKRLLALLLMLAFTANAAADEADLYGGVLLAHHPPDLVYSAGEDWCARYHDTYAISHWSENNARSDIQSDNLNQDVWYVIAAFHENKIWCGIQFGLGDYDANGWYMTGSGNCLANSLEIPTPDWPGPITGVSIAATDIPYSGNYVPVYWFVGYTYSGEPTLVPIDEDPSQNFIGFGNCEAPAGVWPAEGGGMGFFMDGIYPVIGEPDYVACCDQFGECLMMEFDDCYNSDGIPYPGEDCDTHTCNLLVRPCCFIEGTCELLHPDYCSLHDGNPMMDELLCDPNPCFGPVFACCFADCSCELLAIIICEEAGGVSMGETSCDPNPCSCPMGACCYADGSCIVTVDWECDGDLWIMDGVCDPNPCPSPPTPAEDGSWGDIKTMYR